METWHDDRDDDFDGEDELRDVAFGGKDAILFLIDASSKMHRKNAGSNGDDEGSPFEMSLRCVHSTLRNKIFAAPSDIVAVLFFGTREKVGVRDFENLSVFLPFEIAEGRNILKVDEYLTEHPVRFDSDFGSCDQFRLHEALWQSQTMFNDCAGKVASKKILLFTCSDDPHGDSDGLKKQATKKSCDLAETGISLELLPVGTDSFDVKKFYVDLLQETEVADVHAASQRFDDLLSVVKKRVYKKRSLGRIRFRLGGGVELAVSTFSFVQRATKPSKVRLTMDTNEEVKTNRQFINFSTGAPLLPSDINKFQEYGKKKIKFTLDETKTLMAMDGVAGLQLLAFRDRGELRWHHFVRSCHFIYPDENAVKGSRNLFSALLLRCIARNVVAICSLKLRDSSQPNFVALVPHVERDENVDDEDTYEAARGTPKGFLVFYLPFSDDIRNLPEVNFVETNGDELQLAKQVIKKLTLKKYEPEAFENPDLQSNFKLIESLALQQDDVEPVTDFTMPPNDRMDKKLSTLAEQFNATFVKGSDLYAAAKKKAYNPGNSTSYAPAAKKAKAEATSSLTDLPFDVKEYIRNGTVDKLKVDELKQVLKVIGVPVSSKKKAELVEDIYKNCKV